MMSFSLVEAVIILVNSFSSLSTYFCHHVSVGSFPFSAFSFVTSVGAMYSSLSMLSVLYM